MPIVVHSLRIIDILDERSTKYGLEVENGIVRYIHDFCENIMHQETTHATQYMLKKDLKVFGKKGIEASKAELTQMHQQICFMLESVKNLSELEYKRMIRGLMILTQKCNGKAKGRLAYNGKPTQTWISREEVSSPTASQEGTYLTSAVNAHERRDVMSVELPNAYIQADVPLPKDGGDHITIKIIGILVDWLVEIEPKTCAKYVIMENGVKTLYLIVAKAIYGMLVALVLWYKTF